MARAELQLITESGALGRETGSSAAPGNVMGRLTEDRHKIMWSGSPTFQADMLFKGWRVWLLQSGEQRVIQGDTRIAHSEQNLSDLIYVTFAEWRFIYQSHIMAWNQSRYLDNNQQQFGFYITRLKPKPVIFLYRLYTEMIKSLLKYEKLNETFNAQENCD